MITINILNLPYSLFICAVLEATEFCVAPFYKSQLFISEISSEIIVCIFVVVFVK